MTNKAYIVTNEAQEREVLDKLEREGLVWKGGNKPTEWKSLKDGYVLNGFPYVLAVDNRISWFYLSQLTDEEIVFDGRKEEQMADKYVVSQKFMNALEWWKINYVANSGFLDTDNIGNLPPVVSRWWIYADITDKERNNRLIAIIRWVNGEDVFEVEKPKKWVVRSDSKDSEGDYWYVRLDGNENNKASVGYDIETATHFDTKEEAESWANSHQEVIEVEE